jgi:hypothetical protein
VVPLADCGTADPATGITIVNEVVTAALEETLLCQSRAMWITGAKARHPEISELREAAQ